MKKSLRAAVDHSFGLGVPGIPSTRAPRPAAGALVIEAPIHTVSEANQREHWAPKAKRARGQRSTIALLLRNAHGRAPQAPLEVRLVRVAPRPLDGDNLQRGLKAVRDGVADWLGIDDGDSRLTWSYAQEKGAPKAYAVRVEVRLVRDRSTEGPSPVGLPPPYNPGMSTDKGMSRRLA